MLNKSIFLFIFLYVTPGCIVGMNTDRCWFLFLPIEIKKIIYDYIIKDSKPLVELIQKNNEASKHNISSLKLKINTPVRTINKEYCFSKKRRWNAFVQGQIHITKLHPNIFFNPKNKELTFSVEADRCEGEKCDVCRFLQKSTVNKVISCWLLKPKQTSICCLDGLNLYAVQEEDYILEDKNGHQANIPKESAKETEPFFTFSNKEIRLITQFDEAVNDYSNSLQNYFHERTVCKDLAFSI